MEYKERYLCADQKARIDTTHRRIWFNKLSLSQTIRGKFESEKNTSLFSSSGEVEKRGHKIHSLLSYEAAEYSNRSLWSKFSLNAWDNLPDSHLYIRFYGT